MVRSDELNEYLRKQHLAARLLHRNARGCESCADGIICAKCTWGVNSLLRTPGGDVEAIVAAIEDGSLPLQLDPPNVIDDYVIWFTPFGTTESWTRLASDPQAVGEDAIELYTIPAFPEAERRLLVARATLATVTPGNLFYPLNWGFREMSAFILSDQVRRLDPARALVPEPDFDTFCFSWAQDRMIDHKARQMVLKFHRERFERDRS